MPEPESALHQTYQNPPQLWGTSQFTALSKS